MMIVKDSTERAVWTDFDRAQTYNKDQITAEEDLIKEEAIVMEFNAIVSAPTMTYGEAFTNRC
ncbi:hypothetical protein N7447_003012 [Penicillium robsamsonii]|uniref:uncharacterized protein n=1 Tax=Penicillium robsamsonii TaxID=1792511 RepID=UPI0025485B23|nr:uncharacterized protein N7447_003012 [Penicillium robsamsonii]KAJ5836986.1 hypothetical protein N7447_003012 [Penicillium robsamsonii]